VSSGQDDAYIRGGSVVTLEGHRLRWTLIALGLAVLATTTLILTIDAAQSGLSIHHLQTRGRAVQVTVTGCLGLASGTGITPVGYTCKGTFTVQGHSYTDVIGGTSSLHPIGQTLTGITDPQAPHRLFTAEWVAVAPEPWRNFIVPASLFGLLLVCSAFVISTPVGLFRRRRG
jgi:hypothetical protein